MSHHSHGHTTDRYTYLLNSLQEPIFPLFTPHDNADPRPSFLFCASMLQYVLPFRYGCDVTVIRHYPRIPICRPSHPLFYSYHADSRINRKQLATNSLSKGFIANARDIRYAKYTNRMDINNKMSHLSPSSSMCKLNDRNILITKEGDNDISKREQGRWCEALPGYFFFLFLFSSAFAFEFLLYGNGLGIDVGAYWCECDS